MVATAKQSVLTKEVLRCISQHLCSREDCRNLEYIVTIYHDDTSDDDRISVSPLITVFPNIHDRKSSDREGIANHVVCHHFPEIYQDSNSSLVHIKKDSLVHGSYTYKKYLTTKRRKWIKLSHIKKEIDNG